MGDLSSHFSTSEFVCRCGCGRVAVTTRLISLLEKARIIYGKPMRISSGYRCPDHNAAVGGGPEHPAGEAADIFCVFAADRFRLVSALYDAGFRRIGINFHNGFIHAGASAELPQDVMFGYDE